VAIDLASGKPRSVPNIELRRQHRQSNHTKSDSMKMQAVVMRDRVTRASVPAGGVVEFEMTEVGPTSGCYKNVSFWYGLVHLRI